MNKSMKTTVSIGLAWLASALAQAQPFQWTQQPVTGPSPRSWAAMTYDFARHEGVVFGGWLGGDPYNYSDETWVWSGSAWTQKGVLGPSARVEHAMVYDSDRRVTVLFGGATGAATESGETWEWDGANWSLKCDCGPSPRDSVGMAYDSVRHETVLFGGYGDNSETWVWDGTTWTQKMVDGPPKRWGCAMAFDANRGETVLFGGFTYDGLILYGDTWVWDGIEWTERQVTGPSPRVGHTMVYDECRGVVVLFGGESTNAGTKLGDTWEWNGTAWIPQSVNGPSPRAHFAMAYDIDRSKSVLFGGSPANGTVNGETWLLRTPLSITTQPLSIATCPSGTAEFHVSAGGSCPITYLWQAQDTGPWTNLNDGSNVAVGSAYVGAVAGSHAGDLTIGPLASVNQNAGFIRFRCVVSDTNGSVTSSQAFLIFCAADFNCDGFVNGDDYDSFASYFEEGGIGADLNSDGFVNGDDYDFFAEHFESGC
ncbi:MAG: hypothetical protein HUU19_15235 [Phycisphaerales bacterium]|nr:hypothetical protein [Phycisphaerales bacterium]